MHFECGGCHAGFDVPDRRVVGRSLKLRCFKCGTPILLESAAPPAPKSVSVAPVNRVYSAPPPKPQLDHPPVQSDFMIGVTPGSLRPAPLPADAQELIELSELELQTGNLELPTREQPREEQVLPPPPTDNGIETVDLIPVARERFAKERYTRGAVTRDPDPPDADRPVVKQTQDTPAGYAGGENSGLIDLRAIVEVERSVASDSIAPVADRPVRESAQRVPPRVAIATVAIAAAAVAMAFLATLDRPAPVAEARPSQPRTAAAAPVSNPVAAASTPTVAEPMRDDADTAPKEDPKPESARRANVQRMHRAKLRRAQIARSTDTPEVGADALDSRMGREPTRVPERPAPRPAAKLAANLDDFLSSSKKSKTVDSDPIDSLLDRAMDKNAAPFQPSRDQTLKAMRGVSSAVKRCAPTATGLTAKVQLQVAGETGRVTSAQVDGVEGPVAACIQHAVREATFPKFRKPAFQVAFPYKLGR